MRGELIYLRTLSQTGNVTGNDGRTWQYHSRSDFHSQAAVLSILLDLMLECRPLREHVSSGRVGFGVNHEMRDYQRGRRKRLDLVLCQRGQKVGEECLAARMVRLPLALNADDRRALAALPALVVSDVSTTLVALEAKACMTAHVKALPRLYDELASSYQTINADTGTTVACAHVTVNCSDSFRSPLAGQHETTHRQPSDARRVVGKVMELQRRSSDAGQGYDAVGVTLVNMRNDGTNVAPVPNGDTYGLDKALSYAEMIRRMVQAYATRFRNL